MNKTYTQLWLITAMLGVMCPAFSQEKYCIQLGAFTEQIDASFFDFAGFNEVRYEMNSYQYHEYKWGHFDTPEAAERQLLSLQKNVGIHGLNNLKIIPTIPDFTVTTAPVETVEKNPKSTDFQLFTRSVNFNNPKLSLKKTDVEVLEEIATILETNPNLKLRIFATKGKKHKIVKKRNSSSTSANIIKNFLLAQHIPAYRIKTITAENTIVDSKSTSSKLQQVFMTLVDLKEEIVLDKFGNDGYIAKKIKEERILNTID